jgi:DNA-directed RNA polymerase subunit RPC12/RpoP
LEQFSIACTTCQAKLRVRDASAIGQIVTCPKCGSMVLIEVPSPVAPSDSNSALTETSHPKPPPRPGATTTPSAGEAHGVAAAELALIGSSDLTDEITKEQATESQSEGGDQTSHTDKSVASDLQGSLEPNEAAKVLAESRGGRRWILAALAGTTGALMAVTLFAVYAIIAAKNAPPKQTASADQPPRTADKPIADQPPEPSVPSPATADVATVEPSAPISDNALPPATTSDVAKPAPMPPAPSLEEQPTKPEEKRVPSSSNTPLPTAPPEFANSSNDSSKADRVSGTESLSDTLRKLGGLFDESNAEMAAPSEKENPAANVADVIEPPANEEPLRIVRPVPRNIEVAARLNDSIPEIEFTNIPFVQFLQFVTDFSTIPVTLDPDALQWLDITPATPVSMKQRDSNVSKLLTDVLTKLGLTHRVVGQQLYVTRRSANNELKTKRKLNVADLVQDNSERMNELREHILQLIAPESWEAGNDESGSLTNDGTSLVVEQKEEVLFDIIAFCERLRVARGLPIRGKFNPKNFQLSTRSRRGESLLAKPVTLNYSRPTSFVKILDRLSEESGSFLLVDWIAVAEAGWNPDAEVTFTVVNQPLEKALATLLQPMELTFRIVDESTIQIVTPVVLDERRELEIYPVRQTFGAEASEAEVLRKSHELVPREWFRDAGGRGVMRFDAASGSLLVSLSQPQQKRFEESLRKVGK